MFKKLIFLFSLLSYQILIFSQDTLYNNLPIFDYSRAREYTINEITVTGVKYLDKNILINMSGIHVGDEIEIPGSEIKDAIKRFWKQGLFSNVKIIATKIDGSNISLNIFLQEQPRLSSYEIYGVNKSDKDDLKDELKLKRRCQVTDNVINTIETVIKKHYVDKGFYNTEVSVIQKPDTNYMNTLILDINVDKHEKVKIDDIIFEGNKEVDIKKLRKKMKNTKKVNWNFFKASKYIVPDYEEDKISLIDYYNKNGYRDAKILKDSIYISPNNDKKRLIIVLKIEEGDKYYFRNIKWVGNTKYTSKALYTVLGIKKGDIYDQSLLDKRLFADEDAVTSLYLDHGYLFSSITPVEIQVNNDSIDLEMRIYEGKQATINNVTITGNTKTNEHVIRRELRTLPGQLFSRKDIIRSVRELANLGHFDPEKINPNPIPNQADGTVDLEYQLVEKANDQLEVSGGYGGGMLVGTVGLRFSNFSSKNIFNGKAYRPLPSGDGQTLSVRAQSNGKYYQGYNLSFVEPWFGGKKPNSFSISVFHTVYKSGSWNQYGTKNQSFNENGSMKISGASIGLGRRLQWPDDFFTLYNELKFQRYNLVDYEGFPLLDPTMISNNLDISTKFGRNSIDQPIFPRRGSDFSVSLEITPPYSLFSSKDYSTLSATEKYKWVEYHKWKFHAEWYFTLVQNLVLKTRGDFGIMSYFNKDYGYSPFETFDLGGDGWTGYNFYGRENIALRGYEDGALTPTVSRNVNGNVQRDKAGNMYNKFTMELRYPFTLNPQATIFGLTFLEAGNAWYSFDNFNPFNIKRSAGFGIRAFLPMFGLLGVDVGYGFDTIYDRETGLPIDQIPNGISKYNKWQVHFMMGQQF